MPPGRASISPACSASASVSSAGPSSAWASSPGTVDGTTESRSSASRALGAHLAQAREHGVLDARGHRVGRRGERLGDEERVAGRERVNGGRVAPGAGRERVDGLARERRELEPVDGLPGQHPEQPVQRVARDQHLVAQGDDEQRAERADPAGGVAEHVDGGVVGPVRVLDQQHRRPLLGELLHQRREDAVVRAVAGERLGQWTVGPDGGVVERTERPRRDEVVASGHSSRAREAACSANARTRLVLPIPASPITSAVEPCPASARRERAEQLAERRLTLQQPGGHGAMVTRHGPRPLGPHGRTVSDRRRSTTAETGELALMWSITTSSSRSPVCRTFVPPASAV